MLNVSDARGRESCTNPVLSYLCRQADENPRGRKAQLLERLRYLIYKLFCGRDNYTEDRPPHRQTPISEAEIKIAFDAVQQLAASAPSKRKKNDTHAGRPAKRRRGAVDDASRIANEELLRPLFFNRRNKEVDIIIDIEEI